MQVYSSACLLCGTCAVIALFRGAACCEPASCVHAQPNVSPDARAGSARSRPYAPICIIASALVVVFNMILFEYQHRCRSCLAVSLTLLMQQYVGVSERINSEMLPPVIFLEGWMLPYDWHWQSVS